MRFRVSRLGEELFLGAGRPALAMMREKGETEPLLLAEYIARAMPNPRHVQCQTLNPVDTVRFLDSSMRFRQPHPVLDTHANPYVGAFQVRSWSHWFVLGAILGAFIAKN